MTHSARGVCLTGLFLVVTAVAAFGQPRTPKDELFWKYQLPIAADNATDPREKLERYLAYIWLVMGDDQPLARKMATEKLPPILLTFKPLGPSATIRARLSVMEVYYALRMLKEYDAELAEVNRVIDHDMIPAEMDRARQQLVSTLLKCEDADGAADTFKKIKDFQLVFDLGTEILANKELDLGTHRTPIATGVAELIRKAKASDQPLLLNNLLGAMVSGGAAVEAKKLIKHIKDPYYKVDVLVQIAEYYAAAGETKPYNAQITELKSQADNVPLNERMPLLLHIAQTQAKTKQTTKLEFLKLLEPAIPAYAEAKKLGPADISGYYMDYSLLLLQFDAGREASGALKLAFDEMMKFPANKIHVLVLNQRYEILVDYIRRMMELDKEQHAKEFVGLAEKYYEDLVRQNSANAHRFTGPCVSIARMYHIIGDKTKVQEFTKRAFDAVNADTTEVLSVKCSWMSMVADAQAEAGDKEGYAKTIAATLELAGKLDMTTESFDNVQNMWKRIALAQRQAADVTAVKATLTKLTRPLDRDLIARWLVDYHLSKGETNLARDVMFANFTRPDLKLEMFGKVIKQYTLTKNLQEAYNMINNLHDKTPSNPPTPTTWSLRFKFVQYVAELLFKKVGLPPELPYIAAPDPTPTPIPTPPPAPTGGAPTPAAGPTPTPAVP